MLVRSVPLEGGTCDEVDTGALGTLLDAAPRAGLDLPCRSGDADLWFAESPAELEQAKALCGRLSGPGRLSDRCAAARGALGRLGR